MCQRKNSTKSHFFGGINKDSENNFDLNQYVSRIKSYGFYLDDIHLMRI